MFLPDVSAGVLESRQSRYCNGYIDSLGRCRRSGWSYYGRWILAGVVIALFIALFVAWSCVKNRRRRQAGLRPMRGTGWMPYGGAPGNYNNEQQPQYNQGGWFGGFGHKNNNNTQQPPPPPQYTPNPGAPAQQPSYTGATYNSNEGYYGQHQNDVPLQQPAGSYYPRGGDPVYEPPAGPPPAKS